MAMLPWTGLNAMDRGPDPVGAHILPVSVHDNPNEDCPPPSSAMDSVVVVVVVVVRSILKRTMASDPRSAQNRSIERERDADVDTDVECACDDP